MPIVEGVELTRHARTRMSQRGLGRPAVIAALDHGREVHSRGAVFHVIGRNEVKRAAVSGVDIARFEGVHVLCGSDGGVITVYRNKNLDFRPRTRRSRSMRRSL